MFMNAWRRKSLKGFIKHAEFHNGKSKWIHLQEYFLKQNINASWITHYFWMNNWEIIECIFFHLSFLMLCHTINGGLPHSPVSEESACNAGDLGSIPGSGGSSGEGHGNPLQCSHLENPMDRGAWQAIVHVVTRVRHDLATKPPYCNCLYSLF